MLPNLPDAFSTHVSADSESVRHRYSLQSLKIPVSVVGTLTAVNVASGTMSMSEVMTSTPTYVVPPFESVPPAETVIPS